MEHTNDLVDWTEHKLGDPIPASVKKHFFTDQAPPNYTKDYDAIGFDADHCFVKYRIREFHSMLTQIELEDMHTELGYPPEIMDFDWSLDSELLSICLNYAVWDIERGYLIKLGEENKILAAMRGL